ncbi:hypothetical protein FKK34_11775 [Klebsiella quasipneumoniae]|nr:hypothetical protein [Klebsiella quasipneumoniae]MBK2624983.1 hypothetical protein [Klebsiella quasipneumoniae]MBK3026350.1 hypothetical protein [Klebsiella quasipneumoniae]
MDKQDDPENRGHPSCHVAPVSVGWRLAPYPAYGPRGLPLIYSPCCLKLPVLAASKPPVALPLTGATALCDLVARRRHNASPPGPPCAAGQYQRVSASRRSPGSASQSAASGFSTPLRCPV